MSDRLVAGDRGRVPAADAGTAEPRAAHDVLAEFHADRLGRPSGPCSA